MIKIIVDLSGLHTNFWWAWLFYLGALSKTFNFLSHYINDCEQEYKFRLFFSLFKSQHLQHWIAITLSNEELESANV